MYKVCLIFWRINNKILFILNYLFIKFGFSVFKYIKIKITYKQIYKFKKRSMYFNFFFEMTTAMKMHLQSDKNPLLGFYLDSNRVVVLYNKIKVIP